MDEWRALHRATEFPQLWVDERGREWVHYDARRFVTLLELGPMFIESIDDPDMRSRIAQEWADGDADVELSIGCSGLVQLTCFRNGWVPPPAIVFGRN